MFLLLAPFLVNISGCTTSISARKPPKMGMMMHSRSKTADRSATTDRWGHLITTVVDDLAGRDLGVASIAVMNIESKSTEIDVEWIRQKLIAELVALDQYQILSRDRIHELLQEQGLVQTGSIDSERAVKIGKLIGVESFLYGYASMEEGKAILSLQLIKTDSSVILWAKTIDE